MAGLHVISVLLLNELHEATRSCRPPSCQGWRYMAEGGRGHAPPPVRRQASAVNGRLLYLSVFVDRPARGGAIRPGQARLDSGDDRAGARDS